MPATFDALTSRDADWNLDDFVDEVNGLLPDVVPDGVPKGKLAVNARLVRHYTTEGVLPRPLKDGVEARYDTDHLVRVLALRRLLAEGYPSSVAGDFLRAFDRESLARFLLGELRLGLDLAPGGPTATPTRFTHLLPGARSQLDDMRRRAGLAPLEQRHEDDGGDRDDRDDRGDDEPMMSAPPQALRRRAPAGPFDDADDEAHDDAFESRAEPFQPPRRRPATVFTRYHLLDGLELHVRDDFEDPTTPAAWNTLRDAILARLEQIALERVTKR
jgi:DNA-binding transcriptional MerR regulator